MSATSIVQRDARPIPLWRVATATAAVAVAELTMLRVFTRTAIHIPGAGDAGPGLSLVGELGRLAYYLTIVLLIATIVLVAHRLRAHASGAATAALVGIAALVAVALGVRVGVVADDPATCGMIVAVLAVGAAAATTLERRARLPVLLFTTAFVLRGLDALGAAPGTHAGANVAAEVLVLGAVGSLLWAVPGRPDRRSVIIGAIVGAVTIGAFASNATTPRILLLWTFGVPGAFPGAVYGVALGVLVTVLLWGRRVGGSERAIALVLVACGGIGLHSTYQSALVVVGLALLVVVGRPAATDATVMGPTALSRANPAA